MGRISVENAKKFAAALRSGKYKQTKGSLQDHNGHCCLGVACEVFIPKSRRKYSHHNNKYLYGGIIGQHTQPNAPKWLRDLNDDFRTKVTDAKNPLKNHSLIDLNDDEGFTFDMIADMIELVYVHKALD